MERNVILTTMSTLPLNRAKNYYYDSDTSRYCEGIAQTEPGTKLILSGEVTIDEIVVIGSEQTYEETDDLKQINLKEYYKNADSDINEGVSPYAFFRNRICQFCANGDRPLADTGLTKREKELREIIASFMDETCPGTIDSEWLDTIAEDDRKPDSNKEKLFLNEAIRTAIRDDIANTQDYSKYAEEDCESLIYGDKNVEEYIELIVGDKTTSVLMKEAQISTLREQLTSLDMESEFYRGYLTEIINELKQMRLAEENTYIKDYLFSLLPPDKRLMRQTDMSELKMRFIPERIYRNGELIDNIAAIVSAIKGDANTVNLYVDIQGGDRTDAYVRNAIISILTADSGMAFNLKRIVSTKYEPRAYSSAIVDESDRYKITDLVAGMNAFVQYGRADLIKRYCDDHYGEEGHISKLVNEMVNIDKALSICDIESFSNSLRFITTLLPPSGKSKDPVFSLMGQQISNEYSGIINDDGEIDYVEMCQWALKKKFIQQALTIIESKFPMEIVRNGICYYDNDLILPYLHSKYKTAGETEKYKFTNSAYYYIKNFNKPGIRREAGHSHICSCRNERNLLECYKEVEIRRNHINHAWMTANPGDITEAYKDSKEMCKAFLSAYEDCIEEAHNRGKVADVRIYTRGEIEHYEECETLSSSREYHSSLPVDVDLKYEAFFLAAITPKKAGEVKQEIARETGRHLITSYTTLLRNLSEQYIPLDSSDPNLQGLFRMVKEELDEKKTQLMNPILFVDENLYKLIIRENKGEIIEGFYGIVILGRNSQNEWHTAEKL